MNSEQQSVHDGSPLFFQRQREPETLMGRSREATAKSVSLEGRKKN